MSRSRWPKGRAPIRRDVIVSAMATALRSTLGLPAHDIAPGEHAASQGRQPPALAHDVDLGAWIAWALAGLPLFSRAPMPTMDEALIVARRVLLALAMERTGGNVTLTGAALQMSRRAVRERLKAAGLYEIDPRANAGPNMPVVVVGAKLEGPERL